MRIGKRSYVMCCVIVCAGISESDILCHVLTTNIEVHIFDFYCDLQVNSYRCNSQLFSFHSLIYLVLEDRGIMLSGRYISNMPFQEFLQIWFKCSLELKDELIRFWWPQVKFTVTSQNIFLGITQEFIQ